MLNRVELLGRIGKKPELRTSKNGNEYCFLNIAVSERRKGDTGEYAEHTEWISVTAYRRQAINCCQYLDKGSQILMEGKLKTNQYKDEAGNDIYKTEVIARSVSFLSHPKNNKNSDYYKKTSHTTPQTEAAGATFPEPFGENEIPF